MLTGLDAYNQWSRFVDVMTSDPLTSGVRVERLGHHERLEGCVAAAREDAQRQRAPT